MKPLSIRHKFFSPLGNQQGMSLMIVLVMLVVLGLSMGIAGSTWKTTVQKAKEEDLLFIGDQYRRAIENYTKVKHGGSSGQLPSKLEDLLKDPRFPGNKRHIRKLFKDPMTGEDFVIIKDPRFAGRIKGVHSTSNKVPFKTGGFVEVYEKFAEAETYQDWHFIYEPPVSKTKQKVPPGTTLPGQEGQENPTGNQQETLNPGSEANPEATPGSSRTD